LRTLRLKKDKFWVFVRSSIDQIMEKKYQEDAIM